MYNDNCPSKAKACSVNYPALLDNQNKSATLDIDERAFKTTLVDQIF